MKIISLFLLCVGSTVTTSFLFQRPTPPPQVLPTDVQTLVDASRNFSSLLFNSLTNPPSSPSSSSSDQNIVFSPLGVSSLLAILRMASSGLTRQEMNSLPLFNTLASMGRDIDQSFRDLKSLMIPPLGPNMAPPNTTDYQDVLTTFNFIFSDRTIPLYHRFAINAKIYYSAITAGIDFLRQPEVSRLQINAWMRQYTGGYIKQLLSASDISADTKIVLTNAVYLHASWLHPFEARMTRHRNFTIRPNLVVQVPTMTQTTRLRHHTACWFRHGERICAETTHPDMVILPYQGGQRQMIILLPNHGVDLRGIETRYADELETWRRRTVVGEVVLRMPKFEISYEIDLKVKLQRMGLSSPFSPVTADFSHLTNQDIVISKFAHKASIVVDEVGVRAASVTSAIFIFRSALYQTLFAVDQPFIFLIEDIHTKTLLFVGKVTDPR